MSQTPCVTTVFEPEMWDNESEAAPGGNPIRPLTHSSVVTREQDGMNDTPERWLPVVGYEGRYDVSDQGRVRSWYPWRELPVPHILALTTGTRGYMRVSLYRDAPFRATKVHQLVLLAFVGPRPEGWHSRHMDGDPTNNRLSNLTYGTASENQRDRVRLGTHPSAIRTSCAAGHPYGSDTTIAKTGARVCRTCAQRRGRESARRRRSQQRQENTA